MIEYSVKYSKIYIFCVCVCVCMNTTCAHEYILNIVKERLRSYPFVLGAVMGAGSAEMRAHFTKLQEGNVRRRTVRNGR